ncbi:DUF2125 domain-containing protein [Limoniibacter endophyticus]|uniref:DUF2125 domain-containing protein n=1 Tax=Limoniibacter endophyticus TaxID=1565040 RepID=A0A8J3DRW3_9HYPH|nr:DUF2125 domain-containing protein [Limoniibacter endophyticus]GHC76323.1 hypothetical protein GCM10010136_26920 [Limoniibacter endophyticus]
MSSSQTMQQAPRRSRWLVWLIAILLLLVLGYVVGWFYVARQLESRVQTISANINAKGGVAECARPQTGGFPFTLALNCEALSYKDPDQLYSFSAGAFRSSATFYDPFRVNGTLQGPALLDIAGLGAFHVNWQKLDSSIRLARPLPTSVALNGETLTATSNDMPQFTLAKFESDMNPSGQNLQLSYSFTDLTIDPALLEGREVPALSGIGDVLVNNGIALLRENARTLRGTSGTLNTFVLTLGETRLELNGPYEVDANGLLSGNFDLAVEKPAALGDVVAAFVPEAADQVRMGFAFLGSQARVPLRVQKGSVILGFFPVGKIPPL